MRKPLQVSLGGILVVFAFALGSMTTRPTQATGQVNLGVGPTALSVQLALDPVAFELCTAEGTAAEQKCEALDGPAAYNVPQGRRLIIEQVSGQCGADAAPGSPMRASIIAQTKGVVLSYAVIGVTRPDHPGGHIPLTSTRIYADPGSSVTIGLAEVPAAEGRFCLVTFSGQLAKP